MTSTTFTFRIESEEGGKTVTLSNDGLKKSRIFSRCYLFKYGFDKNLDPALRAKFIERIKFPKKEDEKTVEAFVRNAVDTLHETIDLYEFDTVVFPQSKSGVNTKMIAYLDMYNHPYYSVFEVVKKLPSEIEFDYKKFRIEVLDDVFEEGGRIKHRYSEKEKAGMLSKMEKLISEIHEKDYFSIARDFNSKSKYRKYLKNFYIFKNNDEAEEFRNLLKPRILLIDDVMTSGTTLSFIFKTIRALNPAAEIVVFTLIGKE